MRRSSSTSIFQTRCTEEMDIFSRKVWISFRSGPKDTQSSPVSYTHLTLPTKLEV